ncbi:MAG: alpha/beta fold hydrolase [Candidatus Hermodarchaeota archaeon]
MNYANLDGLKICYEIYGEGEPLLLVHGFGTKKETYIGQIKPLSEHFKVIVFDNRGAGKSDRPLGPYTMDIYAQDISDLMDHLNLEHANILGTSLGGMIVQNFVIKYPKRVKKLILINTTAYLPMDKSGLELYREHRIKGYYSKLEDPYKYFFDTARMGYSRNFIKLMRENPNLKIHGLFSAEDLIKNTIEDIATPEDLNNQIEAIKSLSILDRLHEITVPTLILCASHDRQLPKSMSIKIHERIPNSRLIEIVGTGHSSEKEKAPEVNQYIINFLKEI